MNERQDRQEAALGTCGPLVSIRDALAMLAPYCREIAPEEVAASSALDRIAAAPVVAPAALPAHTIALMNGWAVASRDTLGASPYAPCFPSQPPVFVRVGDRLPDFADAVLPPHAVAAQDTPAQILGPAAPGEGARAKGGDFASGEVIVAAGEQVKLADIALMRLAGVERISLRVPKMRVFVPANDAAVFVFLARRAGAELNLDVMRVIRDVPVVLMTRPGADLVFVTGPGDGRWAAEILAREGKILAPGVAMRPSPQIGCGVIRRNAWLGDAILPVIFAPERFDCVLAAWLLLVRPCLRRLSGAIEADLGESLPLARKIASSPGLSDLVLLRRAVGADGAWLWEPLAIGDIPLNAIARADAWLLVEPESEGYAAGQSVFAEFL